MNFSFHKLTFSCWIYFLRRRQKPRAPAHGRFRLKLLFALIRRGIAGAYLQLIVHTGNSTDLLRQGLVCIVSALDHYFEAVASIHPALGIRPIRGRSQIVVINLVRSRANCLSSRIGINAARLSNTFGGWRQRYLKLVFHVQNTAGALGQGFDPLLLLFAGHSATQGNRAIGGFYLDVRRYGSQGRICAQSLFELRRNRLVRGLAKCSRDRRTLPRSDRGRTCGSGAGVSRCGSSVSWSGARLPVFRMLFVIAATTGCNEQRKNNGQVSRNSHSLNQFSFWFLPCFNLLR